MKNCLAFDYGASSGRAILGNFDGEKIKIEEVHRFKNTPVKLRNTWYWDFLDLYHNLKQGIIKGCSKAKIDCIGIDTWGVDFGLIGKDGHLMENPVHYRDERTEGMMEEVFSILPREELYNRTGIQMKEFNTIFQLFYLSKYRPDLLDYADKMLLMPDLFTYFLTGEIQSEHTIASTTQLFSAKMHEWDFELIGKLGLPKGIFPEIVYAGNFSGKISSEVCGELQIPPCDVLSVASHDTASAVLAVPTRGEDFVYISSGTWSLMGIESKEPFINPKSLEYNFTNEGGFNRTIRFLKNIMGLWILQECKRQWSAKDEGLTFDILEKEAMECKPFEFIFNPNHDLLMPPGDMESRIRRLCGDNGGKVPQTRGEMVRAIYENLAFFYRKTMNEIEDVTGKTYSTINVVGGGSKDELLMQFTANATGKTVIAGPSEATALGNIAAQLISTGEISTIEEARDLISKSVDLKYYYPVNYNIWNEIYQTRRATYE